MSSDFVTRLDSNQPAQLQKIGINVEFWDTATIDVLLSSQGITKELIRLS